MTFDGATDAGDRCEPPVPTTGPPWQCPACCSGDVYVRDTRAVALATRRRKCCRRCGHAFTTFETIR